MSSGWDDRIKSTRTRIEAACLETFEARGFDQVSVEELAIIAGVGRRTFFRYFPAKADAVFGELDDQLARFRAELADAPAGGDPAVHVAAALLCVNSYRNEEFATLARRMELIARVPALQAHAARRFSSFRQVASDFARQRAAALGTGSALYAAAVGTLSVAAVEVGYDAWVADGGASDPRPYLRAALDLVLGGLVLGGPGGVRALG